MRVENGDRMARGLARLVRRVVVLMLAALAGWTVFLWLLGCHFHVHVAERVVYERSWGVGEIESGELRIEKGPASQPAGEQSLTDLIQEVLP